MLLPNVIGAIDDTLVEIGKSSTSSIDYNSRKQYMIANQAICHGNLMFLADTQGPYMAAASWTILGYPKLPFVTKVSFYYRCRE